MDNNVLDVTGKIKQKIEKLNQDFVRETTASMATIVTYKLRVLGSPKVYDDLDIWETVLNVMEPIITDTDMLTELDKNNPPYLAKLKLYDIICNKAVEKLLDL